MNSDQFVEEIRKAAAAVERDAWAAKIYKATHIAGFYGPADGAHHKMWVIDQMVRELLGEGYTAFREHYPQWDQGIAP